jgi:cysteine desulfurase/selenocysteine lyase
MFDVRKIRDDFPILHETVHGKPLVYLDNGATTQKPKAVIDRLTRFYEHENANIHRGVYELSQRATTAYERSRVTIANFINAPDPNELIFTRGVTEAINLVASTFTQAFIKPGDEIVVSAMEHHSNIVPWQLAAERSGAKLRVIPMNDAGELELAELESMLSAKTKIVSVVHVSNSLGTINDIARIVKLAYAVGAKVLVDGAQWVAHHPTDVQRLGCDFYAFSGHKLFGPTGIGALWGRRELLTAMPPYHGGGDMIESVTFEKTTYADIPNKFEAGTPDIAGVVGLAAAVEYVNSIGFENFEPHEAKLIDHAAKSLGAIPGIRLIGTASHRGGVVSFVVEDPPIASFDIGTQLDHLGIAVRTGHHCCQPVMTRMGVPATIRASFALYNTLDEVEALAGALRTIIDRERGKQKKTAPAPARGAALAIPEPAGVSPQAVADAIADDFEMMGEWDERYQYLISMGDKLPLMPTDLKIEANRVYGCQSTVHLFPRKHPGAADRLDFLADSDADLVRGLIAVLQRLFSGQRANEILAFDIEGFFNRLGLDQNLTMGRRNGLASMIQKIRAYATNLAAEPATAK